MKIQTGPTLWNRAKKIIPGGSQLLSKRAEMFLPNLWPSYFKRCKGVEVWDLDDNHFIDMCIMGIGACNLGYADEDVNRAVKEAIDLGTMATLNCPEEVELAELLLELNPWAKMVRYARTGAEAVSIAIRIARAYSKKDIVAFCGYHGWSDWYLAANLSDKRSLDGHLLKGLHPAGLPRNLKGTVFPFNYNQITELETIVENNEVGVIIMEPIRNYYPKDNFLKKVQQIANEIGAVYIIDEISSGWRLNVGGAHQILGIEPDIAVYAKAMSNGYPMAAVVGRGKIMDEAQNSFISSTYWTERIGPTAALATIQKMQDKDVPSHLISMGKLIKDEWVNIANEHDLKLRISGISPLPHFEFNYAEKSLELRTLFTQEMLKYEYLASNGVYISWKHTEDVIEKYFESVDQVFGIIANAIEKNNVRKLLAGPVAHSGFQRLT
ncbi:MAG: aminotransferase class III-fold pyridoxal phosphate-dependent enzyme [Promethearchaeota archaeon]